MEGYSIIFNGKLITIWSAPNYCYWCGNVAGIILLNKKNDFTYKVFNSS